MSPNNRKTGFCALFSPSRFVYTIRERRCTYTLALLRTSYRVLCVRNVLSMYVVRGMHEVTTRVAYRSKAKQRQGGGGVSAALVPVWQESRLGWNLCGWNLCGWTAASPLYFL